MPARLQELRDRAETDADMSRGEIVVIVVGGARRRASARSSLDAEQVLRALLEELPPAQAAKIAARLTGAKRAELYEQAIRLSGATGWQDRR